MTQETRRWACSPRAARGATLGLGALVLVAGLSACEGFSDALGLGKSAPDEFAVVRSTPLTLPPDFTLRPPRPGEAGPNAQPVSEQARGTLLRESGALAIEDSTRAASQGESAFIEQAGAEDVDPNIRHIVDREFSGYASEDESFIDSLMFWREDEPAGEMVDAEAEAERLRGNAEAGNSPADGESPTIERRE